MKLEALLLSLVLLVVATAAARLEATVASPSTSTATPSAQTVILETKAVIAANSPDAFKLGAVRRGDVITLQYLEGKWKDHGVLATANPDDKNEDKANRLVIALPSNKNGEPGTILATIPSDTATKPYSHTVQTTRDQVVLRISSNSDKPKNPGSVTYQVKITR